MVAKLVFRAASLIALLAANWACAAGVIFQTSATATQYSLSVSVTGQGTVTSAPAGISCGTSCTAELAAGTTVTLTATPSSGSQLAGFGGACSGTGSCTVTMSADTQVTAAFAAVGGSAIVTFALVDAAGGPVAGYAPLNSGTTLDISTLPAFNVQASTSPSVVGSVVFGLDSTASLRVVNSPPYDLADGTWTPTVGSHTITATPYAHADGGGTVGTPLTINIFVTQPAPGNATLTIYVAGSGTVTSSPSGINCGTTCSASYAASTPVTLTATAGSGYAFTGWSGSGISCMGTGNCAVTMSAPLTVTATFTSSGGTGPAFPATIGGVGVTVTGGTPTVASFPFATWMPGMTVAVAPSAVGTTWYVDTGVTASGTGHTLATAFKTIDEGLAAAGAGDTILISTGHYRYASNGAGLDISKSGTPGKPITLGAYGNGEVIIDASAPVTGWSQVSSSSAGAVWRASAPAGSRVDALVVNDVPLGQFQTNTSAATVLPGSGQFFTDGATITADMGHVDPNGADIVAVQGNRGSVGAISLNDSSYVNIIGLTVRGSGWNGIWSYPGGSFGTGVTIALCDIKFNDGAGVIFDGGTNNAALYNHIYHNVLTNWPFGANAWALDGGGWPGGLGWASENNPLARGNVSMLNGGEGIISYGTDASRGGGVLFEENLSIDNWSMNCYVDSQPNPVVRNNLFARRPPAVTSNWYGTNGSDIGGTGAYYMEKFRTCLSLSDETGTGQMANAQVYNNLIVGCRFGIMDYWEISSGHGMKHDTIVNNTIIMDSYAYVDENTAGIALSTAGDDNATNTGTIIANNIIYRPGSGGPLVSEGASTKINGIALTNNLYFAVGSASTDSSLFATNVNNAPVGHSLASWQSAESQDSTSKYADPLFASPSGLVIGAASLIDCADAAVSAMSPAKGLGIVQSLFSVDFTGATRGASWTTGAFQ